MTPGSGRSSGEGNGYPLQYSCLEKSMDRGARQAIWGCKESDTAEQLTLYRSRGIVTTVPICEVVSSPSSSKEGTNVNPISTERVSKNWRHYF